MKMPTIVGIFIFIGRENFMLNCVCWAWKKFHNPTSEHKILGSNPAGVGIQRMTIWPFTAQILSLSPFHRLDMT